MPPTDNEARKHLGAEARAGDVFTRAGRAVDFDRALVFLDANALLLPYTASNDSLPEIKRAFEKLKGERRLVVPGQVAKEYGRNRASKIADIYKSLGDTMSEAPPKTEVYPLLSSLPEYEHLKEKEAELHTHHKEYRKRLEAVRARVREWSWSDPVRDVYSSVFTPDVVVELDLPEEQFEKIRADRYKRKIPPGYKDASKDDGGGGDLAIWLTVLQTAKSRQRDAVFVSADEKADWFHQSGGVPLFPRWELLDEFRRETGGQFFTIVRLSRLLEQMAAAKKTVEEIRRSEDAQDARFRDLRSRALHCTSLEEVLAWLRQQYPDASFSSQPSQRDRGVDVLVQRPGNERPILVEVIHAPRDPSGVQRLGSQMQLFSPVDASSLAETILLVVCHSEGAVVHSLDMFRALGLPVPGRRIIGAKSNGSGLDVLWALP